MDARLHTELWTSWASLLRSYCAAHGLNSQHHAVVEVGPDVITLRVNQRWIRFTADSMERDDCGAMPFRLLEDGTVQYADVTEEMDHAAERLSREMLAVS
jgi:hypothetical protein